MTELLRISCFTAELLILSFIKDWFRRRLRKLRIYCANPHCLLCKGILCCITVLRDSWSYSSCSYSILHSAAAWGYPNISTDFLRVQLTTESILLFLLITPPPPADIEDFLRNTEISAGGGGLMRRLWEERQGLLPLSVLSAGVPQ